MIGKRDLLVLLVGAAALFVYYGIAQAFPWGASTATNFSATSGDTYVLSAGGLHEAPPETWTSAAFDRDFVGRSSTLATDQSFSWIFSVPRDGYDLRRYFAFHAITQIAAAALLLAVLRLLGALPRCRRLLVVGCLGIGAAVSSYGAMSNWLGMPLCHGIGEGANLAVSWLLAATIMDRLLVPSLGACAPS